jgi:hypothetical protein
MAHVTVTIDGQIAMDDDTGEWTSEPPQLITQQLAPNAKPAVWMETIMRLVLKAAMTGTPVTVEVTTHANGWEMTVSES